MLEVVAKSAGDPGGKRRLETHKAEVDCEVFGNIRIQVRVSRKLSKTCRDTVDREMSAKSSRGPAVSLRWCTRRTFWNRKNRDHQRLEQARCQTLLCAELLCQL